MNRLLTVIAGTIVAASMAGTAVADEQTKLKRKVLSDCSAAKTAYEALDAAGKEEMTSYFARVLELHLASSLAAQPQLPDTSRVLPLLSGESKPHELSLPVDPADEIRAKNCALELLGKQGKDAFTALPSLLELIDKPTTPYQLKQSAANLSRSIASLFAHDSTSFSAAERKTLSEIPLFLEKNSAFAARAALIELGGYALPAIIERIPRASEIENGRIVELLQSLQLSGISPTDRLYPLLIAGDEAQQVRVIRILVQLSPPMSEILPPFIRLLDDISPTVRQETRRALKKLISAKTPALVVLDPAEQDLLLKVFRIAPPVERREMLTWLPALINVVDGMELKLIELFASQPPDLRQDIISCIAEIKAPRPASLKAVETALRDPDATLRSEAIKALGRFKQSEAAVLKHLNAALQALPPARDSVERESIQRAVAEAIATLHPHSVPPTILTSLTKMLEMRMPVEESPEHFSDASAGESPELKSRFLEHPAVKALIAIGEPARQSVEKIAKPGNSDQSRRATAVLGGLPAQPSTVSILSALLDSKHQGTRTEATHALLSLGSTIIPLLRKQIGIASPTAAVAISEITIRLGEKTLADSRKIYKSLKGADCPTLAQGIILIEDFPESERIEMAPKLIACIGQNHMLDHEAIKALSRLAPLPAPELDRIIALLRSQDISPQLRLALLDSAHELAIPADTILPLFQDLLNQSADTVQVRLIRSLGKFGSVNPPLIDLLKGLVSNDKAQRARSDAAVTTLARTARDSFDFEDWISEQLEEDNSPSVSRTLKGFPDDFAQELLIKALGRANDREKLMALTLLSQVVKPTESIPPEVASLLGAGDIGIRFAAFRVASACCPLTPEAMTALKDILFSNEIYQFEELPLSENTKRALEAISLQSDFLSERVSAKRILLGN